jgi:hypothetical protein
MCPERVGGEDYRQVGRERIVVNGVFERRPPFNPQQVRSNVRGRRTRSRLSRKLCQQQASTVRVRDVGA